MPMQRVIFLFLLLLSLQTKSADLVVGTSAPAIDAKLLDSNQTVQVSPSSGKVTIINFWATWCGRCKEEMPALQAYYDKHKSQGLEVLAISMDEPRNLAEVRKVAQAYTFPIAMKSEAHFKGLGRFWRMPTTFVIDKHGILRKNGHIGDAAVDLPAFEALVTPLLSQP
jgi:thiol-disulfide isomerase/thioredoxin